MLLAGLGEETHALTLDVGASSALDGRGQVTLNLNNTFRDVDRMWLVAQMVDNPNFTKIRIRFVSTGFTLNDGTTASVGGDMPPDAIYLMTATAAAPQVVQFGTPIPVFWNGRTRKQTGTDALRIEVLTWAGAAVTFDNFALQFLYTRVPHVEMDATSHRVQAAMNELRGVGRN